MARLGGPRVRPLGRSRLGAVLEVHLGPPRIVRSIPTGKEGSTMFRFESHRLVSRAASIAVASILALLAFHALGQATHAAAGEADQPARPGLHFVDYRHLQGGPDGVALIDLDPDSEHFGEIVQDVAIGEGVLPHHLYFDRDESRLYTTALGGSYLYEILLTHEEGFPRISGIEAIDTGGNMVGENLYFTRDGSRFYMTFMAGLGGDTGGSVGVFDARTNELLRTITAPVPDDPASGEPFIMYAHGISANEDIGLLMVTSTIHPDLVTGVGNTVTLIDLETDEVLETYLVGDDHADATAPVEVLMLRRDQPPFALANAMLGGDVWIAAYDEAERRFGEFERAIVGAESDLAWPLEYYVHTDGSGETELYISFALPGLVNVYGLDDLPELPLRRSLPAAPGAHHMSFFETASGREVMVVQNNLLNLDDLNDGSLMVVDVHTGEVLANLDLAGEHGLMPESIESAYGHGHDYHH
jgi:hypothetical protein